MSLFNMNAVNVTQAGDKNSRRPGVKKSLLILLPAVVVTACGGGGGSGSSSSGGGAARSNTAHFVFDCDLNGANGQLDMDVEIVSDYGITWGGGSNPDITGVIGTGSYTLYTYGQLVSNTAYYTFTGENNFADFVDHYYNERFRVQWQETQDSLIMIVNPFGPGPTQHSCQLTDSYYN